MNVWDIVIIIAVALLISLAVFVLVRSKKQGKGCCSDCSKCSGCNYKQEKR